jgi:hypothetical protein
VDLPLCQDSILEAIILKSKSNLLSKDFVPEFWLVFHPLQYQLGYDDIRFLDKPSFQVIYLV